MSEAATADGAHALHLGIAEQGKLAALAGDQREALIHYRAALRMAMEQGAPEMFCRHYVECMIESLELAGDYEGVLEYCEQARGHYDQNPPQTDFARRDLAHLELRRGVNLLKLGSASEADAALEAAAQAKLPLAAKLLRWVRSGLHLDANRVLAEQRSHDYFSVREGQVDPSRAIELPASMRPPTTP